MFKLYLHFAGGGGCGSASENLNDLISITNDLINDNKVIWLKIIDTDLRMNVLECTGITRWYNKLYFSSSEEIDVFSKEFMVEVKEFKKAVEGGG